MIRKVFSLILIGCLLALSSCKANVPAVTGGVNVYYINSSYTALVSEPMAAGFRAEYEALLNELSKSNTVDGFVAPLTNLSILSESLDGGKLTLEFGREYETLKGVREVLTRAAIVRTLLQCEEIRQVEFIVSGNALTDAGGKIVGAMDKDTFVGYFGREQDELVSRNVTIYYSNSDGSGLIREVHRLFFDNTQPTELAVIKYMTEPPEGRNARVAISSKLKIININTTDGTCHIDMDMQFYDSGAGINLNVSLMALVNTLCELENVRRVSVNIISTGDDTTDLLMESVSGTYEKDLSLLTTEN